MSKTLIGMVTFGNLQFTKLAIESVKETTTYPVDYFVVVGKPGDQETIDWLTEEKINFIYHEKNYGFPYSLNDIYDHAWKENDYENLIILGNDIICYPYAIDSLIELADSSDYLVISALQYDVRSLKRLRIMNISLGDLKTGQYRSFSKKELQELLNLCEDSAKTFDE